jgi:hypothetical protein
MCGKTEMAQCLSERLGVPYFKNNRERKFFENDPGYFVKALKYGDPYFVSYLQQTGASVILDRSFPSEFVYSKVLNRPTNMDILRMVDTMYADVGAKIIIPYRTSYADIKDDKFDTIDSEMLVKLDATYREFITWTSCETLLLCVDDENLEREMAETLAFIHGFEGRK